MNDLSHIGGCHCEEEQVDLRVSAQIESERGKHFGLKARQVETAAEKMRLATVIRFPTERTRAVGEP